MKRNLLLLLFTVISFAAFAQFEFNQTEFDVNFDPTDNYDVKTDINIANISDESEEFIWNVEVVETTEGWNFFVCDLNKCYGPGLASIDEDGKNVMEVEETGIMYFHLAPNATAGTGIYKLNLTNVNDATDIIQTLTFNFNTVVDVSEEDIDKINIFPNPVNNYFQLENPNNVVSHIQIYDILGKKAMEFNVEGENSFDVSGLHTGRYFARIFDKDGKSIKVVRLIKA
jgi:hypothetical protein